MIKIKKAGVLLLAVLFLLTGCAAGPSSGTAGTNPASGSSQAAKSGYAFKTGDLTIYMHDEAAPILEKLGEPKQTFEAESCAFQGKERTYVYTSFSVYTYELDGVDHIASVVILDDSIGTPEGIYLNSTLDDVKKAYGDKYEESVGLYTYKSDTMKLSFLIKDNVVTSIEYVALADN
ncbi:MAG: hypothetical protein VB070_13220 [Clostridiaceae bacterium]|nr:hypothetical protein [Clostridiaceae bacterium]